MKTKKNPKTGGARSWYERIWQRVELSNTNPKLAPYLDVKQFPGYQANVTAALISQSMTLTPVKKLKAMTPEKLGLVLGQKCANFYALGDEKQVANLQRAKLQLEALKKHSDEPSIDSALHALGVAEAMYEELAKDFPQFEKTVHAAFKAALKQPNYQEAVQFFRGFAKGIAKPGLKDGRLAGQTDATPLQLKMFLHPKEAAQMKTVGELRGFLLKNGFTEQTLGDETRLQKFCTRIGYAPGKTVKPASGKNKKR